MSVRSTVMFAVAVASVLWATAGTVGKSTPPGFTDDFDAACAEASKSGKLVLAVFSGSDWCYWCKVLESNYLSKPEFVEEAKKDFVLVFIDSPRDKKMLSEVAKRNNGRLVTKYNIRGFPTVKMLDAAGGEIVDCRPKRGVSPKGYAEQLRHTAKTVPASKKQPAASGSEAGKAAK